MDFSTINLDALVPKLEARRVSLNLSYQNVADACNVSQSTIIRILNGRPTRASLCLDLSLPPSNMTSLHRRCRTKAPRTSRSSTWRKALSLNAKIKIVRLAQQEAQFMRQHNEDRRLVRICLIICIILVLFVCFLFGYDIANLDRGWIQARSASGGLLK